MNKKDYRINTPAATIGIRGTSFGADDCTGPSAGDGPCKGLEPAVYVSVTDGEIIASNAATPIAGMADEQRRFYALQFHPEVNHTPGGAGLIKHFVTDISGVCSAGVTLQTT